MNARLAFAAVVCSVVLDGAVVRGGQTARTSLNMLPPGALARLQPAPVSFTFRDGPFAISPDGRTLAATIQYSSQLAGVAVHDLASGRTIPLEADQQAGRELMSALAFSPDGKTLVGGNSAGDLYSWSLATGKPRSLLADEERGDGQTAVRSLAFSPDGRYLAVGRDSPRYAQHYHGISDSGRPNTTLIVRNAQTGEKRSAIAAQTGGVTAVAFSPDGQMLWSGGRAWERSDRSIRRWDIPSGQETAWAAYGLLNYLRNINWQDVVNTLAVSADGQMLVAGSDREGIQVWNVATAREAQRLPGQGAWFGPDGDAFVVADGSWLRFWNLSEQKYLRSQTVDPAVRWAAVLPSGDVVARSFEPGLLVLEPSGATRELRLSGLADGPVASERIDSLAFSADGSILASVGPDSLLGSGGSLHLWHAATGKERPVSEELGGQEVRHAAFSADGTKFATTSIDGASIWDALGVRALHQLDLGQPVERGSPTRLSFSPDGVWLATANSAKSVVHLWNASTGSFVRQFIVPLDLQNTTVAFAFSPDGMSLVSATLNVSRSESVDAGRRRTLVNLTTRVCVWETATGRRVSTVDIPETGAIALSPDGRLTVGARGDAFRVREVSTGKEIWRTPVRRANLRVAVFSPDARLVALGDEDGAVHLWDLRVGTEVQRFAGHAAPVSALAFASDGTRLASGAEDGAAFVWRVNRTK